MLRLAPFGCGNPAPVFAASAVEVVGVPVVWKERHLRVNLRQCGRTLLFKAWDFAGRAAEFSAGAKLDVALELDDGYSGWGVVLKDVRPAAYSAPLRVLPDFLEDLLSGLGFGHPRIHFHSRIQSLAPTLLLAQAKICRGEVILAPRAGILAGRRLLRYGRAVA